MATITSDLTASAQSPLPVQEQREFCLLRVMRIVRAMPLRFAAISLVLLLPCFWQPQIEAGDLASHIYNAWLVQAIQQGKAPGLWIGRQWTNVLFDFMLDGLIGKIGAAGAQRLAVGVAVLIFFWGAFALVSRISEKLPWFVTPLLAILSYGTIFNMGLFNYYLAGGLSVAALAVLWRATMWDGVIAVFLLAVAWLAQPLPVLWTVALFAYICLARRLSDRSRLVLFGACICALFAAREFILTHWGSMWQLRQVMHSTGADESFILGHHYRWVTLGILVLWAAVFLQLAKSMGAIGLIASIPVQLYLLCVIGCSLLPNTILFPWYSAWFGGVDTRIAWLAAVIMCAIVARVPNTVWYARAVMVLALVYFCFLYADHRALAGLERRVAELVSTLPPGQRVIGDLYYPPNYGFDESMILDRVCIGKCFSFSNYEAATGEFRVHSKVGNSIVPWAMDPQHRAYSRASQFFAAQPNGTLYHIYPCGSRATDVCMRSLKRSDLSSLQN